MSNNDFMPAAVLTYHSIDSSGSVISTSPEAFREQMRILAQSGLRVLPLRELANKLTADSSTNTVAITFDDGFRNVFEIAYPVLKEYGFPATIFLVTSFCGKNNRWYGQPEEIPTLDLLTWDNIEKMTDCIEFGGHTATHPDLTRVESNRLEDEILGSLETLRQHTGQNQNAFAYPYGKQSTKSREIVQRNYYAACSTVMDFVSTDSDLFFLPRIDMYYFSRNRAFSSIGTPAFRRYIRWRAALRQLRSKLLGAQNTQDMKSS